MSQIEETYSLTEEILVEMGLQPLKRDGYQMEVEYKGENFLINITPGFVHIGKDAIMYVRYNDPWLSLIKEAANITNHRYGYTIIWGNANNAGFIPFRAQLTMLLAPQIPHIEIYLKSALDTYFVSKEIFTNTYMGLMDQSMESDKMN